MDFTYYEGIQIVRWGLKAILLVTIAAVLGSYWGVGALLWILDALVTYDIAMIWVINGYRNSGFWLYAPFKASATRYGFIEIGCNGCSWYDYIWV